MAEDAPELELVARRFDFLSALSAGPATPSELADRLGYARSTVNRALRELEPAGLVARSDGGYVATTAGRLAHEDHRRHRRRLEAILDARELLEPLAPAASLPPSVLVDADRHGPGELDRLREPGADGVRVALAGGADPETAGLVRDWLADGLAVDAVIDPAVATATSDGEATVSALVEDGRRVGMTETVPAFSTLLFETAVAVVVHDDGALHGVAVTETPAAIEWAEDRLDALWESAVVLAEGARSADGGSTTPADGGSGAPSDGGSTTPVDADTIPADADTTTPGSRSASASPPDAPRHSPAPEAEGFLELSEAYLDRRRVDRPVTCWRRRLDLPEVHAGYAIDRERPGEDGRTSLTEELLTSLRRGEDLALLGPPGSGKSTACKSVACAWFDRGHGPVLYREGGESPPVDSPSRLVEAIAAREGHVLVVVEDAVRSPPAFEAAAAFADDDRVSFLFDARTAEWESRLRESEVDSAALDRISVVPMPRLDERECARIVDRFERESGSAIGVDPDTLLASVRADAPVEDDRAAPGEVFLLFHRLSAAVDPLAAAEADTPFLEHVRGELDRLSTEGPPPALAIAAAVNLANAAGFELRTELIAALTIDLDPADVRRTTSLLEGVVLYPAEEAGRYRTIHDAWSTAFLSTYLEEVGPAAAHRRLGRRLTALCSLADDPDARDRLRRRLAGPDGGVALLDRIEADPAGWTTATVRALFRVGLDTPALAPLFGRTGYESFELPAAAPAELYRRCVQWRARMYYRSSRYDRADHEYASLGELEADGETALELEARSLAGLARVASRRGRFEEAERRAREAIERFESIEDPSGEARCLNDLGGALWLQGRPAEAERWLERARERARSADDPLTVANALNNLGLVAWSRGELDAAERFHEDALERWRAIGDRRGTIDGLTNLGVVARDRGDLEGAAAYFRRAVEVSREIGERSGEANGLRALGELTRIRGDLEAARRYATLGLEGFREIGDEHGEADGIRTLGTIDRDRGELDAASRRLERALERYRELGDRTEVAHSRRLLASVDRRRGETAAAEEGLREALAVAEECGSERQLAYGTLALARTLTVRDVDAAEDHLGEAHERMAGLGDRYGIALAIRVEAELAERRGEAGLARERYAEAFDRLIDVGALRDALDCVAALEDGTKAAGEDGGRWRRRARRAVRSSSVAVDHPLLDGRPREGPP